MNPFRFSYGSAAILGKRRDTARALRIEISIISSPLIFLRGMRTRHKGCESFAIPFKCSLLFQFTGCNSDVSSDKPPGWGRRLWWTTCRLTLPWAKRASALQQRNCSAPSLTSARFTVSLQVLKKPTELVCKPCGAATPVLSEPMRLPPIRSGLFCSSRSRAVKSVTWGLATVRRKHTG